MTEHTEPESEGFEDFDAFWAEQDRRGTVLRNVFGVNVELPPSLPMRFEVEAHRVQGSAQEADVQRLVGLLFGERALARWVEAGMDLEQFGTLLMWGSANVSGTPMSLTRARDEYRRQEAAKRGGGQGKARKKNRSRKSGGSS